MGCYAHPRVRRRRRRATRRAVVAEKSTKRRRVPRPTPRATGPRLRSTPPFRGSHPDADARARRAPRDVRYPPRDRTPRTALRTEPRVGNRSGLDPDDGIRTRAGRGRRARGARRFSSTPPRSVPPRTRPRSRASSPPRGTYLRPRPIVGPTRRRDRASGVIDAARVEAARRASPRGSPRRRTRTHADRRGTNPVRQIRQDGVHARTDEIVPESRESPREPMRSLSRRDQDRRRRSLRRFALRRVLLRRRALRRRETRERGRLFSKIHRLRLCRTFERFSRGA